VAAAVKAGVERSRAARRLQEDDGSAEVIARAIFGANDGDERYDLVVDLGRVSPQAAAEAIAGAAANERYQPTSYSRTCLKELEASHRLAARLAQELELDLEVTVYQGAAKVRALAPERKQKRIQARAESLAQGIDGVTTVEVLVVSDRLRPIPAELR
jgi:osmotically-inducible protein OsmY